ncbi:hypothetical protein [Hyalangium sp.]|uniref:hypothetical protein n=1 Tax=Hyalangium sp. TaxID=2028555 RepID=UPI002D308583|nr:hypothetical protein [Hyalangium sp.]HYH96169.1 hypothetical protein [Hyalangium sp.]
MADPTPAYAEAIHVTEADDTTLSDSNKLEETSSFDLNGAHTVQPRQNLNSDGHTKQGVTWHEYSGSLEYRVVRNSTVQGTIHTAAAAGTSAWVHVINNPAATAGQTKGYQYEIFFDSNNKSWPAGDYINGSVSFKVSGAPVPIVVEA